MHYDDLVAIQGQVSSECYMAIHVLSCDPQCARIRDDISFGEIFGCRAEYGFEVEDFTIVAEQALQRCAREARSRQPARVATAAAQSSVFLLPANKLKPGVWHCVEGFVKAQVIYSDLTYCTTVAEDST